MREIEPHGALPLVSITTATYNCAETLSRTIESVLHQSYRNVEYIIKDARSEDGTYEVALSYREQFEERGYGYKVVSRRDNGMYEAINQAMDMAEGDLIGNINGDDYLEPEAAETVAREYVSKPFDLLYCSVVVHTGKGSFVKHAKPVGAWPTSRNWSHPGTFLACDGLGMRYRLDNLYADFDLYLRCIDMGMRVRALDKVVANFNFGGVSTRRSLRDALERIAWRNQVQHDNHCPPMTYVEGVAIEMAKLLAS